MLVWCWYCGRFPCTDKNWPHIKHIPPKSIRTFSVFLSTWNHKSVFFICIIKDIHFPPLSVHWDTWPVFLFLRKNILFREVVKRDEDKLCVCSLIKFLHQNCQLYLHNGRRKILFVIRKCEICFLITSDFRQMSVSRCSSYHSLLFLS